LILEYSPPECTNFESKDLVKQLGGRWDPQMLGWYFYEDMDLELFEAWIEHPVEKTIPKY
jgi:hypothetical protein